MKREKLQQILSKIKDTDTDISREFDAFEQEVNYLKDRLKNSVYVKTINETNSKIDELKGQIDFSSLSDTVSSIKEEIVTHIQDLYTALEKDFKDLTDTTSQSNKDISGKLTIVAGKFKPIDDQLQNVKEKFVEAIKIKNKELGTVGERIDSLEKSNRDSITSLAKDIKNISVQIDEEDTETIERENEIKQSITSLSDKVTKDIDLATSKLHASMNSLRGGGGINRQMFIGGVDPLTKYTDMNLKAGTNVTLTYATNDTTKQVDVTITASGSGGGTVRSINSVSTNTAAGATAGTDYVYLCSGTMTLTLPTAVANTNLYTIKNVGSGTITVATTSAQTIDGSTTISLNTQYTAVDIISDTVNWNVT